MELDKLAIQCRSRLDCMTTMMTTGLILTGNMQNMFLYFRDYYYFSYNESVLGSCSKCTDLNILYLVFSLKKLVD